MKETGILETTLFAYICNRITISCTPLNNTMTLVDLNLSDTKKLFL